MKKVVITGASGFIGRYAIKNLENQGYEVHAVSRYNQFGFSKDIFWHNVDLFNYNQVRKMFEKVKPSHLLHFAWNVHPGSYQMDLENFSWIKASMDIINLFERYGGQRVVCAGTCAEYDWRYGYLTENLTPCNPTSNYGICKKSLNELLDAYVKSTNMTYAWGRNFFLYGPYEKETRLVASTIKALLMGKPALCTRGDHYRDFMYVEDAAEAFCALLNSTVTGTINIASGEPTKISEIVQLIARVIGRPDLLHFGALSLAAEEPYILCANTNKLNNEVGWKPSHNIHGGIEKTINWWKAYLEADGGQ